MSVNLWAVLVSAVAAMAIGSVWFGPLFGKMYIKAMGWENHTEAQKKEMMKGMMMSYVWQFIASLVMFFVLGWFIAVTGYTGAAGGIHIALLSWLGYIVTLKFGDVLWGGKKVLFWLSIGNSLITLVVAGAILGVWR